MEAVDEFLASNNNFAVDRDCENYFLTFNPSGWLRRL
jgi:cephalosporin hydroxylase